METARLKAAVEELQSILSEIQDEYNEFNMKKADWYYNQLEQNSSGLTTNDEFIKETSCPYHELLDTNLGNHLHGIEQTIGNLERTYEFFKGRCQNLEKVLREAKNRVPEGWKRWQVTYDDSQCSVPQTFSFFAPSAEEAGKMCLHKYSYGHNVIVILKVEVKNHD